MDDRSSGAFEAYLSLLRREQEDWLYRKALDKVQVITRSMSSGEKDAYLKSESFQNTLRQVQRKDPVWQGLSRNELVRSANRNEFNRLKPMIEKEQADGHPLSVPWTGLTVPWRRHGKRSPWRKRVSPPHSFMKTGSGLSGSSKPGLNPP